MGEVHIQSATIAKVGVHPASMQHHLRDAFFDYLVVLRPGGSQSIKRNNYGEYDRHKLDTTN